MKAGIAMVTGATAGIGEATSLALAHLGYDLIICGRRTERLNSFAETLRNKGVEVYAQTLDVRNREDVTAFFANLPERWKAIDVLVNNAGLAAGLNSFADGNLDDWDAMIDTNVKGLLYVSRFAIPIMIERKKGHIINIGSIAGKEIYPNGNVYCGTKHAVDALSKAMRRELAGQKVKVTAIHPGAVETEFSLVRFNGDAEKAAAVYEGFDNLIAEDIAEAITWCITRPLHVNINDLVIMPVAQPAAGVLIKD
jgi:hypothetical protein